MKIVCLIKDKQIFIEKSELLNKSFTLGSEALIPKLPSLLYGESLCWKCQEDGNKI